MVINNTFRCLFLYAEKRCHNNHRDLISARSHASCFMEFPCLKQNLRAMNVGQQYRSMTVMRIIGCAVALLLAGESTPVLADGSWSELQAMPAVRQEFPAVLLDGKIYAAGGMMNFMATAVNRFESYDIRSDRWQRLSRAILRRHHLKHVGRVRCAFVLWLPILHRPNWLDL